MHTASPANTDLRVDSRLQEPLLTPKLLNLQGRKRVVVRSESNNTENGPIPAWPAGPTAAYEIIDAEELARRWGVPQSWVEDHTRSRAIDPIPCIRLGRYVKFQWVSPDLYDWWNRHSSGAGKLQPRKYRCKR